MKKWYKAKVDRQILKHLNQISPGLSKQSFYKLSKYLAYRLRKFYYLP